MNGNIETGNDVLNLLSEYPYTPNAENMKYTSIIILTFNQLDYTKLCIESIRKFTHKDYYEIIVVDNNSTDGTIEWLRYQEDLKVIYNKENKGFPAGCNQGIKIATGESVLLLNNDTIVTPNWLNDLNKALYSKEDIGAVGPITNSYGNHQEVSCSYKNLLEMIQFSLSLNALNKDLYEYKFNLIGYCYLIKKQLLDKIGLLDERFTPGNYEDDDLSLRIINEGYTLLCCKDIFIHHFGGTSFKKDINKFNHTMIINHCKLKEKWGFDIHYYGNARSDIINMMVADEKDPIKVLEVGCGVGGTLMAIKNKYKNSSLYGIEYIEKVGKIAKALTITNDVIIGNIETLELSYEEEMFDYIIFGDVLEHLIDPWETLRKLKKYLKKDGFILASIPNVMHISVINNLIRGRFQYTDQGLLDKTHLRFFTYHEIVQMFASIGHTIVKQLANTISTNEEETALMDNLCKITNEGFKIQYYIYQYLICSKANN